MNLHTLHRRGLAAATFAVLALAVAQRSGAEDIDIFTAGGGVAVKPNVLFILDSSSNWSATLSANSCNTGNMAANTKFAAEVCALSTVVPTLSDSVRLGLMLFTESGSNGAYVRYGMRSMTDTNKSAFTNMIQNFVSQGSGTDNSGSNQPYAKAMFEAFKYFGGYTSPAHATDDVAGSPVDSTHFGITAYAGGASNSTGTKRRDFEGNNAAVNRAAQSYGADSPAALPKLSDDYNSAIVDNCAKNFIIFISNGNPGTGGDSGTPDATTLLRNVQATTLAIPSAGAETHASKMDEFALFLNKTDVSALPGQQKVITYTIAVYQPQSITYNDDHTIKSEVISNTDQQMIALMKSAAAAGGGKYFAGRDAESVALAILTILNEVQAVNSVFVSASLPVSVNNQGTYLNQVYMGMFRPDGSGTPNWLGNVKEYQFSLDATTGSLFLTDSAANRVVNPVTGFISPSAVSFWTKRGTDPAGTGWPAKDFWVNSPSGTPASASDSPDGEVVEKGGAGEMQRIDFATSQATRKVLTCLSAGCSAGSAPSSFDSTTISGASYQSAFGVGSASELTLLVNWIRGEDNAGGLAPCAAPCLWTSAEGGPGWPATVRPSIHGDVLHSRPVVLNYPNLTGCSANGCAYVFYGANDGTLRAIKGQDSGHEQWAFVAPEFFGKYKRQRLGTPVLQTPRTPTALLPYAAPKSYFFDGPIGAWQDPDGTNKWIFAAARRGGAVIYAFDVTDPANPKFMWKKTATDLPNLGQSWSMPQAFKLTGDTDPTLIFGAGYDPGEDNSPATSTGVGRGIYVLNARTGAFKTFIDSPVGGGAMPYPVPSDIALTTTSGGQVYRGYVGDTGGNIWRLDMPDNNFAQWKLFKFASLGSGLKFFYAPDIVHSGPFDVILVGSGDREKPLVTTSADMFFGLYDQQPAITAASSMTALTTTSLQLLSGTSGVSACSAPACNGWYRTLLLGEKVVNSPLTVAGVTYFATNQPTPSTTSSCATNLGLAKSYSVQFLGGGAPVNTNSIFTTLTGGGLPPSAVGGIVELASGQLVTFVIGAGDSGSAIEVGRVTLSIPATRRKVYWNSKTDS